MSLKFEELNQPKHQRIVFVVITSCEKKVDRQTMQNAMYTFYYQIFLLFFRDSILKDICKYTNKEGYYKLLYNWTPMKTDELKIILVRCCSSVCVNQRVNLMVALWSKPDCRLVFSKLFSRNIFRKFVRDAL